MSRVYNFSSGPAAINEEILKTIQHDMLDCMGSGMSILEMNHKSEFFGDMMDETSELLRELMHIGNDYEILYVNGGGYGQFSMVPMNLMNRNRKADYVDTDLWTKYAVIEAQKCGTVNVIASSAQAGYTYIPEIRREMISADADYLYMCTNNTASGSAYRPDKIPNSDRVPIVADMTSNFMSETYDINKFGLVFAAAQKNLGPAGVTVVIAKKTLIEQADEHRIPRIMCYKEYAKTKSTFSTPSTFAIYMIMLVLKWVKKQGGIPAMTQTNHQKASMLYDFIDNSTLYHNDVCREDRSIMNVVFTTGNDGLDACFSAEAAEHGLCNLSGYQGTGKLRAGIYNGVSVEAVNALVDFMKKFENEHKGENYV
ncbi:MAG: 3-phosphoserine/phosphohydroxythreonine transaminase [Anaerofustis sp.]